MIVDTSALIAFFDRSEPDHASVTEAISAAAEPLVVSPYVVAEVEYLVASRLGSGPELDMLRELAGGAWDLAQFDAADLREACGIIDQYVDQDIGVADASNVVLAAHHGTRTIATLDHRHFEVLRPTQGGRFTIVP